MVSIFGKSKFGKHMWEDTGLYINRDRLNKATFRRKLDLLAKNVIRRQNLLELVFKDIFNFDMQNPMIGSLVR